MILLQASLGTAEEKIEESPKFSFGDRWSVGVGYSPTIRYIETDMFGAQRILNNSSYNSKTKKTGSNAKAMMLEWLGGTVCGVSTLRLLTPRTDNTLESLYASYYVLPVAVSISSLGIHAIAQITHEKGNFLYALIGEVVGMFILGAIAQAELPEAIQDRPFVKQVLGWGIISFGGVIGYNF
ncbi:hypothetical protein KAW65_06545 [candidate division WOR-3 bacterium]|nr:hypothetical protein [candidate division WOR-3 bacterium]